jgi:protein-tyrosine phosphatase
MAEYLFRSRLGPESGWESESAGLAAGDGMPATDAAVAAMQEIGIDLSVHRSRAVRLDVVEGATVVAAMTAAHHQMLQELFPDLAERVYLFKSFSGADADVADPIGGSLVTYRRIRDEIDEALPDLILFLHERWGVRRNA